MMIYVYRCTICGYQDDYEHGMLEDCEIWCPKCGGQMRRRPQKVRVNWGGLRPSQGEIHPNIKAQIENAPRYREEHGL